MERVIIYFDKLNLYDFKVQSRFLLIRKVPIEKYMKTTKFFAKGLTFYKKCGIITIS